MKTHILAGFAVLSLSGSVLAQLPTDFAQKEWVQFQEERTGHIARNCQEQLVTSITFSTEDSSFSEKQRKKLGEKLDNNNLASIKVEYANTNGAYDLFFQHLKSEEASQEISSEQISRPSYCSYERMRARFDRDTLRLSQSVDGENIIMSQSWHSKTIEARSCAKIATTWFGSDTTSESTRTETLTVSKSGDLLVIKKEFDSIIGHNNSYSLTCSYIPKTNEHRMAELEEELQRAEEALKRATDSVDDHVSRVTEANTIADEKRQTADEAALKAEQEKASEGSE